MITRRQLLQLSLGLIGTRLIPFKNSTFQPGTELIPTHPLLAIESKVVSKVGVHVVAGKRTGFGTFVQSCAAAGRPVAVVKCVGDFGAAVDAKNASPLTLTVGRVEQGSDGTDMRAWDPANYVSAEAAAETYYQLVKNIWAVNPLIDVWETFNEMSSHWNWQADFYIRMMDLAEADRYRLGLWSASAGNPPETVYDRIARACQRAKQHGNHILCLHEYSWDGLLKDAPPVLVTRYRQLYSYLAQHDAVIPLVISECGQNGGGGLVSLSDFIDDYTWYDNQLLRDQYVVGCAAWTLGNWEGANFQAYLPDLAAYIINKVIHFFFLPFITNSG